MARALSFQRASQRADDRGDQTAGSHANPCFAGDTVRAWSEVLDVAETAAPGVGAIRLRLVAVKEDRRVGELTDAGGEIPAACPAGPRLLGLDADLSHRPQNVITD